MRFSLSTARKKRRRDNKNKGKMENFANGERAFGVAVLNNRVALRRVKINRQFEKIGVFLRIFSDVGD